MVGPISLCTCHHMEREVRIVPPPPDMGGKGGTLRKVQDFLPTCDFFSIQGLSLDNRVTVPRELHS